SVLAVTTPEDEVLVVDDASTDNTAAVLAEFGARIHFLPVPHGGAGAARNHGIRRATRPLIAFLDSDDEWLPDKMKLQRAFLERRPEVLFCFSNFRVQLDSGEVVHVYIRQWHRDPRSWDEILAPGSAYSDGIDLPKGCPDFRVHVGS